jgi:hypothetical protein
MQNHKLEFNRVLIGMAMILQRSRTLQKAPILVLVDPGAGHLLPVDQLLLSEPQGNLLFGGIDSVGSMHNIAVEKISI